MNLPLLIIHGWSDSSSSFRPLGRFLRERGADVREVFLGDYLSMQDEITLADVGFAMIRALRDRDDLSLEPQSFDVVVHSTGGLVVREFLRQFCRDADGNPDARRTPIRNLLMLAPANFGSALAKMGKSMVGRLFNRANCGDIALAVLDRDHGNITKDIKSQRDDWRRVVLDSLSVDENGYAQHVAACDRITRDTFQAGRGRRKIEIRERFHEYMHVVFRVTDQYGNGIDDYFVEFYQQEGDNADAAMEKIHGEILEKVKVNSLDKSYRTFFFDLTDLRQELEQDATRRIDMSVVAANPSEDIAYRNPPAKDTVGIRVFEPDHERFFLPNRAVLVDLIVHRDPTSRVFEVKTA